MSTVFFLLSFLLGLLTLIGLFSPKTILRSSEKPTRGKVLLFFGLPSFLLFLGFGMLYESPFEEAMKNPLEVVILNLSNDRLETIPTEVDLMLNLKELDLSKNKIASIPDFLLTLEKLEVLNLEGNPINELPAWLGNMPALREVNVSGTGVEEIPEELLSLTVNYRNTPLWLVENPATEENETSEKEASPSEDSEEEDREESLGEYALRQFLGRDYGQRRKFKKGEIYYNDPVTKDQVDQIGEFMILMEFFNDEREASMLLDFSEEDIYELMIVVVSEEALTDEVIAGFTTIEGVIQQDVFGENEFHLVLTDGEFDPIKTIK